MNPASPMVHSVLVVEDDPVSAAFLGEAAAAYPAHVDIAGSLAEALEMIRRRRYALLLVDVNLPDGRGEDLLQTLQAGEVSIRALAHTAELDTGVHEALLRAGFAEVLCKPLGVHVLHAALARHLPDSGSGIEPAASWDDAAALAAVGGEQSHVDALRNLFLAELPAQCARVNASHAAGDVPSMRAELHRLTASCGFVGAARLASKVRALHASPDDAESLHAFNEAADALTAKPRTG